jgi:hypothetical protein
MKFVDEKKPKSEKVKKSKSQTEIVIYLGQYLHDQDHPPLENTVKLKVDRLVIIQELASESAQRPISIAVMSWINRVSRSC